ncbi:unnamed protein product [Prorocentrum cordatum]|uniref:Uncharacterized protein n=1 Tax=Prorocentrum cordatum TaxID=2364126 RepID=A0ABN9TYM7_9DINO|nr:unnamed protein product [Polarella glacialis]
MAAPGGATRLDLSSGRPLDLSARLHGSPQAWKPASDTSWLHDALAAKLPPTPTTTPSNRCATTWIPEARQRHQLAHQAQCSDRGGASAVAAWRRRVPGRRGP